MLYNTIEKALSIALRDLMRRNQRLLSTSLSNNTCAFRPLSDSQQITRCWGRDYCAAVSIAVVAILITDQRRSFSSILHLKEEVLCARIIKDTTRRDLRGCYKLS
jgi:hypothetical protein